MRKHNGMRPQDIVILLKIIALGNQSWQNKDLAQSLFISSSEISEALNRNEMSGLIDHKKKRVNRQPLMEFLEHGLHYVFPQHPGSMVNGMPTAHCHPYMKQYFDADLQYVWADSINGEERGLSIEPLYPGQVKAARLDAQLYKFLALIDVIRVGRVREIDIAKNELKKDILYELSSEYNTH